MQNVVIKPRRKQFGLRLAIDLMKEIKHYAVDEAKPLNDVVEEALRDFLKKHRRKPLPNLIDLE